MAGLDGSGFVPGGLGTPLPVGQQGFLRLSETSPAPQTPAAADPGASPLQLHSTPISMM